ncbi:hypothetical protein [Halodesulfovibrio spirochaetisodalis]|uniref:Uncharacterized protein n=1 Tax=Halodesulfovibrio spirochaetisodalis TaxID=1560234 RepID=A0A1B7X9Q3_9BACT|nr:hypothetical protein [Halodesulfovibrio spirochaetisodalis]OBQ46113.1 hypothetical protein SP90_14605 [Halodesulfovibrio spirochaetisodalis]
MEELTLAQDGTLKLNNTVVADILSTLSTRLVLEKDVTLRSFFSMFSAYPEVLRLNPFLQGASDDAATCTASGCITEEFSHLELYRQLEMTGAPGTPEMNIHTLVRGINNTGRHELRFFRLNNLLDMPFSLGQMRHVIFGDRTSELYCNTTFSLFEVIEGIAWELSFQGGTHTCSLRR